MHFNEIVAVDKKAGTFTIYEGPTKNATFTVNAETNIFVDGNKSDVVAFRK